MSVNTVTSEEERVSKVTFSPINSEAIVVSIRSVAAKPGEIVKMDVPKPSGSRKKPRSRSCSENLVNKSTMTDSTRESSIASQTSIVEEDTTSQKYNPQHQVYQQTPCLKHAAENIAIKSSDISSEKVSLCNNCSKSMLSYVFVVQDFLDSLAKEICGQTDAQSCLQCMREQVRQEMVAKSEESSKRHSKHKRSSNVHEKSFDKSSVETKPKFSSDYKYDINRDRENVHHNTFQSSSTANLPQSQFKSSKSHSSPGSDSKYQNVQNTSQNVHYQGEVHRQFGEHSTHENDAQRNVQKQEYQTEVHGNVPSKHYGTDVHRNEGHVPSKHFITDVHSDGQRTVLSQEHFTPLPPKQPFVPSHNQRSDTSNQNAASNKSEISSSKPESMFGKLMERHQPTDVKDHHQEDSHHQDDSNRNTYHSSENIASPLSESPSRIISGLSNVERDVYDSARNAGGWEGLTEAQERVIAPDGRILSEAFVTMCRNNAEALGCLVLGTSLILTQTTRTLCVVVSDGVSMAFRAPLSAIFHEVQTVRSLDSLGTTKLALLEQPELGISFDKLNVWRLKQFHKCVYLNPDTLVIQNCDELFNRDELSAVPDIGWPDCFNSGVFVFSPSDRTFWKLLEFSGKQENCDGGDQALLNSFFKSWSNDINKKLSFIYNLMANVSYTYTPAFRQFGRDIKIVQFHGTFKPWHVKFFNVTGLISPTSNVHPNYVEFVNKWIKIFKGNALRQLSQEIQSYAATQELICAVELLRFFPLPSESEAEFFLTPPSVRLRLTERKLHRIPKPAEEHLRRKSAEFRHKPVEQVEEKSETKKDSASTEDSGKEKTDEEKSATGTSNDGDDDESNKLPGSEVGNYQGMKRWEQGKMDYQGTDSSDAIIKRLEFLMLQNK